MPRQRKTDLPPTERSPLPVFTERFRSLFGENETQQEFANRVGLVRNTLCQYYNGHRTPDSKTLRKICERCNVTADWLVGISDVKTPDAELQAVCNYTGLSSKSIEAIRRIIDKSKIGALNKALSSNAILESLCAIMLIDSKERGYYAGTLSPENGFYNVIMSPDSFAAALGFSFLHTLEAVRTNNSEPLKAYPPIERKISKTIEELKKEGRI